MNYFWEGFEKRAVSGAWIRKMKDSGLISRAKYAPETAAALKEQVKKRYERLMKYRGRAPQAAAAPLKSKGHLSLLGAPAEHGRAEDLLKHWRDPEAPTKGIFPRSAFPKRTEHPPGLSIREKRLRNAEFKKQKVDYKNRTDVPRKMDSIHELNMKTKNSPQQARLSLEKRIGDKSPDNVEVLRPQKKNIAGNNAPPPRQSNAAFAMDEGRPSGGGKFEKTISAKDNKPNKSGLKTGYKGYLSTVK